MNSWFFTTPKTIEKNKCYDKQQITSYGLMKVNTQTDDVDNINQIKEAGRGIDLPKVRTLVAHVKRFRDSSKLPNYQYHLIPAVIYLFVFQPYLPVPTPCLCQI